MVQSQERCGGSTGRSRSSFFSEFFAYEWVEESKVKDEMYHELQEWALGFATFLSLVLLVKILYTSTGI